MCSKLLQTTELAALLSIKAPSVSNPTLGTCISHLLGSMQRPAILRQAHLSVPRYLRASNRSPSVSCLPACVSQWNTPKAICISAARPTTCTARCVAATSAMSTDEYAKFQEVAVKAAHAAGRTIEEAFTKDKDVHFKGKLDLVTATDQECEQTILTAISEAFPDHKFIGEEGSSAQGFTSELTDAPTWMVDPLDGTTNFVHRFPFVCTSIALVIKKEIVVGVVYNPVLKELFTAIKGKGAFLNGQPIKVSTKDALDQALLATEIGVSRDEQVMDAIFDRLRRVTMRMRSIRCSGACALNLCSVACGRIDVMYEVGFGGCWDCAAGALIVTEAGGEMLDPSGSPFNVMARRVLGANAYLGKPVAEVIVSCKTSNKEPAPLRQ